MDLKKWSVSIRSDIDAAVRQVMGKNSYSEVTNRALLMFVQAAGIEKIVERFESEKGPLTDADFAEAHRRLERGRRQAKARASRR